MQGDRSNQPRVRAGARWLGVVAVALPLLVVACGSDDGGSYGANTTPPTASTNTLPPAETTTLPPTIAASTVAPTTDATQPVATTDDTASTETATTEATDPTDTTSAGSPDTSTPVTSEVAEFSPADPPAVPDQTEPVQPDNSNPDGVYYATVSEGGDPPPAEGAVVFEIVQLFLGESCVAHFGADDEDACVNDYGVETDPTASLELQLTDQYITVVDAATQESYRVSGPELYRLILGDVPTDGAPPEYIYSGFGFLVTFEDGTVTRLEQWWTP